MAKGCLVVFADQLVKPRGIMGSTRHQECPTGFAFWGLQRDTLDLQALTKIAKFFGGLDIVKG